MLEIERLESRDCPSVNHLLALKIQILNENGLQALFVANVPRPSYDPALVQTYNWQPHTVPDIPINGTLPPGPDWDGRFPPVDVTVIEYLYGPHVFIHLMPPPPEAPPGDFQIDTQGVTVTIPEGVIGGNGLSANQSMKESIIGNGTSTNSANVLTSQSVSEMNPELMFLLYEYVSKKDKV